MQLIKNSLKSIIPLLLIIIIILIGNNIKKLLGNRIRVSGISAGDSITAIAATSSNSSKGTIIHEIHHAMYITKTYVIDAPLAAALGFYIDYCENKLRSRTIKYEFSRTIKLASTKNYNIKYLLAGIEKDVYDFYEIGESFDSYLASARIAARIFSIFGCDEDKAGFFFVYLSIGCKPRMAYAAVNNVAIGSIIYSTQRGSLLDFFDSLNLLENKVYDGFFNDLYVMQALSKKRGTLFAPINLYKDYINNLLKGRHQGYVLELGVSCHYYLANNKNDSKKIIVMQDSYLDNSHQLNELSPDIRYKKFFGNKYKSANLKRERFWVYPGLSTVVIDTSTVDSSLSHKIADIIKDMDNKSFLFKNNKHKIKYTAMNFIKVDSGAMVIRVNDKIPWEVRVEPIRNYHGDVIKSIVVFNKGVKYKPVIKNALWLAAGTMVFPKKFIKRPSNYYPSNYKP